MSRIARTAGLAAAVALCLVLAAATPGPYGPSAPGGRADDALVSPTNGPDPAASAPPAVPPPGAVTSATALSELSSGDEQPTVELDAAGNVVAITAPPGGSVPNPSGAGADGFVRRYAGAFGLTNAYSAQPGQSWTLPGGDVVTRYQQTAGGVPMLGGEIVVTADAQGAIKGAVAEASQATPTSTVAAVSAAEAGRVAVDAAASRFNLDAASLTADSIELWLYDPALIGAPGRAGARPTWWVEVIGPTGGGAATVLVDGTDAAVALALTSKREAGPDRIVCDLNGIEDVREFDLNNVNVYACNDYSTLGAQASSRREGGGPSTVNDVNAAYDHLGVTHAFYQATFGIDSFDGRDGQLRATTRACQQDVPIPPFIYDYACPFRNAFWDGYQFVFGAGFAVDDVTAHEYTHAVIDHTSQLFYAYQSGAINEALADIFGEFVDQSYNAPGENTSKLWLIGEDLPLPPGGSVRELRDMSNPGRLNQPSSYFGAGWYAGDDDNGGVHRNSGVANRLAYLIASGGTVNFTTFPGIGVQKSRVLWYRAMHLMPSGGDYPTLGRVLEQACVELVGHDGFTAPDCFNTVRQARIATGVNYGPLPLGCGGGSTADPAAFQDDFEQGSQQWSLTEGWYYLPSPEVPVSYAASGKSALYGWSPGGGPTGYATMNDAVTIPSTYTYGVYLSYRLGGPSLGANQTSNGPAWEYDDVNDAAGWQHLTAAWGVQGGGYTEQAVSIAAIAGKTVKLRLRVQPGGLDWLVDDVRIGSCTHTYFARPYDISAIWSGTSAVMTWTYDSMPQQHIELSYDPPIPGAPSTLPGLGVNQSSVPRSVTLTGLDPATTYMVTITIVDDQNHQQPRPVSFELKAQPDPLCLTNPPLPFYLWTAPRPSDDPCGTGPVVPRRA